MTTAVIPQTNFVATRNACKLCTPFGACLAFKGIRGCVPFLHGSQGYATYVRRYMISHFRDPVDIASSNFSEELAIFGGERNLATGLENVTRQYNPEAIGIASTCLSETIGDDVERLVKQYRSSHTGDSETALIHASTPSYQGTHAEGFQSAVRATVESLAESSDKHDGINLIPGMLSPADLRELRDIGEQVGVNMTILPDYADTLDGPAWDEYHTIPPGGTPCSAIRRMAGARATLQMTSVADPARTAAGYLAERFNVPARHLPIPIGLRCCDIFMNALSELSKTTLPTRYALERGRLLDAYVDAHKYVFGKRVVLFGEEDWVVSLVSFLTETGLRPVLAVSGGRSGQLENRVR